ncbi:MAG: phosphate-starvation-inducible PsiE family protein [Deltaproteobacteria bacterium]|nr:phosphate-starvation-inducible PsiE family protein [Deltaproteobacteria bacterium]
MDNIERIKAHYNFTAKDVLNLKSLLPLMEAHRHGFVEAFYGHIKNFEDTSKFLKDAEVIKRHQEAIGAWFLRLFSGEYGPTYFQELERVGTVHVDINLSAHYVNTSMHFVKMYMMDVLKREVRDPKECLYLSGSVDKILDINLDVFTSSYIEEEKKVSFISYRVESYLIHFSKRFSYGLNLTLVLGLVVLGVMVMGLFIYDLTHMFEGGEMEKGLLSTLGSLLMLWVVIELMDTEIEHLKGGKFTVKIFISVALVAVIRKILVASLAHEALGAQLSLIAAVAVLGGVYWLISRVEK